MKSTPSSARTGIKGKKAAARNASFADFVAGTVSMVNQPGQNPATVAQLRRDKLEVKRPDFQAPPPAALPPMGEKQAPGSGARVQPGLPDQSAPKTLLSARETAAGSEAKPPPAILETFSGQAGHTRSAKTAAGRSDFGPVDGDRGFHESDPPVTAVRGHRAAEPRIPDVPSTDRRPARAAELTNPISGRTQSGAGERESQPNPVPAAASPHSQPRDHGTGSGSVPGLSADAAVAATGTAQTTATGPGPAGWSQTQMDVLLDRMIQQVKSAPSSLEVQLKPEILGNVNIRVESREGAITISIAAQNTDTAGLLSNNLASMRSYLEQQGVNLQQMEVNQGYGENRGQSAHQQERGNKTNHTGQAAGEEMNSGGSPSNSRRIRPGLNILA